MKLLKNYNKNNCVMELNKYSKVLWSYKKIACWIKNDKVYLSFGVWDYSKTTTKYVIKFLQEFSDLEPKYKKDIEYLISQNIIRIGKEPSL